MKLRLPIYTLMHFLVDLTCIYRFYSLVMPQSNGYENWILLVVLYNFLAFAMPALVGLIADLTDSSDSMAALGCVLAAIPAWQAFPVIPMVILQGMGNGLFHVGVGRRVLLDSHRKYAPSGIFICSGALGVFLGTVWKKNYHSLLMYSLSVALLFCAGMLFWFFLLQRKERGKSEDCNIEYEEKTQDSFITLPVMTILLVVILRSFYGTVVTYEWKTTFMSSFFFVLCIVAGKAFGGIAADCIGVRTTAILSVGGAAITVLFSAHNPFVGCLSILLFNMTMPLTLSLIAGYWREYPGLAFGTLMLALFIGTIPNLIGNGVHLSMQGLCAVSLISLLGLLIGIGRKNSGDKI